MEQQAVLQSKPHMEIAAIMEKKKENTVKIFRTVQQFNAHIAPKGAKVHNVTSPDRGPLGRKCAANNRLHNSDIQYNNFADIFQQNRYQREPYTRGSESAAERDNHKNIALIGDGIMRLTTN
ncbi:hypothetical protein FKM82_007193 [Ascaphus truei]